MYNVVNPDWPPEGTVVIDVGVQRINNKLTGELDREKLNNMDVKLPVPGGVGPKTVAMLMSNVALAWHLQNRKNNILV